MKWLVIPFIWVVYSRLRSFASNRNFTFTFFFKFLLCCTTRSNNLTNNVNTWIIRIGNEDLLLLFRWFIISRWYVSRVQRQNFIYKPESFFYVPVFVSLLSCIGTKSSFRIVNWLRRRGSNIRIISFKILNSDPLLQIIYSMSSYPYFNFKRRVVSWKVAKTLRCKCFDMSGLPPSF